MLRRTITQISMLLLALLLSFGAAAHSHAQASAATQTTEQTRSPADSTPQSPAAARVPADSTQKAPAAVRASIASAPADSNLNYATPAVSLAIAVTALMGVLFFFLFSWSARVERSTFFGHQFQDTVEQAELRRLSQPIDERWQRGLYHRELLDGWTQRAQDWLEEHPVPTRDENLEVLAGRARRMYELDQLEPRYALQPADFGNRRPGTTLPPGIGGLGADERLDDAARKDQEDFQRELSKHRRQMRDWIQAANRTLAGWRDAELEGARTEAKKQASRAISIDIPYLRGRGPEFVLSFTAIVVIIFSAVILGVLKVLHPDQIGTLLAAIAGYVLGRTTAPGAATRPDGGAERKPSPPSGGSGAGAQAQTAGG